MRNETCVVTTTSRVFCLPFARYIVHIRIAIYNRLPSTLSEQFTKVQLLQLIDGILFASYLGCADLMEECVKHDITHIDDVYRIIRQQHTPVGTIVHLSEKEANYKFQNAWFTVPKHYPNIYAHGMASRGRSVTEMLNFNGLIDRRRTRVSQMSGTTFLCYKYSLNKVR